MLLIFNIIFACVLIYFLFFRPYFPEDTVGVIYIFLNLNKLKKIDDRYFNLNDKYIVVFRYSWLFEIYRGRTKEEIKHSYSWGSQSNRADYLRFWQKIIGKRIEKWYLGAI